MWFRRGRLLSEFKRSKERKLCVLVQGAGNKGLFSGVPHASSSPPPVDSFSSELLLEEEPGQHTTPVWIRHLSLTHTCTLTHYLLLLNMNSLIFKHLHRIAA